MTNIEKLLLIVIAFPVLVSVRAWVWSTAWNWAATPVFGVPHSTTLQAAVVVIGAVAAQRSSDEEPDVIKMLVEFVVRSSILLAAAATIGGLA